MSIEKYRVFAGLTPLTLERILAMEEKYEQVGLELRGGMNVSLHKPGYAGNSGLWDVVDLVVEGRNGSKLRIELEIHNMVTGQYVVASVRESAPFIFGGVTFPTPAGVYEPNGLSSVAVDQKGKMSSVLEGVPNKFTIKLPGSEKRE